MQKPLAMQSKTYVSFCKEMLSLPALTSHLDSLQMLISMLILAETGCVA